MLSVFFITGISILLWILVGYSLSFEGDYYGMIGNFKHVFMNGIDLNSLTTYKIPTSIYSIFEMFFAIISPALFVGAVVGRIKFKFLAFFIILWSLFIYYPMVHMVWSTNGFLAKLGTLDFAGGTVVHINAGVTAFVLSAFLGRRIKKNLNSNSHYNLPWILLGTTILWIGWYGFNAGSAFGLNNVAMQATVTTTVAAAASMVSWVILDIIFVKKPQLIGACTGTLCGLVGITPSAGYVTVFGSFIIGICATLASYLFVNYLKAKIGVDDALDAFGCHGVSGILGSIMTGLFATKSVNSAVIHNGLFYGGGFKLLGVQTFATVLTILFVAIFTAIIILFLKLFMPMRVNHKDEVVGLDRSEHGEDADYTVEISDGIDERKRDMYLHSDEFQGQFAQLNSHSKNH